MELYFEPVTEANRQEVVKLHTAPGQEGFVEDVSECFREADKRRCWRPFGIYDGDTLVGFAMYEKYGFRFNGQHDTHGEDVMVYRYPSDK